MAVFTIPMAFTSMLMAWTQRGVVTIRKDITFPPRNTLRKHKLMESTGRSKMMMTSQLTLSTMKT
jgi:hypothetical protein